MNYVLRKRALLYISWQPEFAKGAFDKALAVGPTLFMGGFKGFGIRIAEWAPQLKVNLLLMNSKFGAWELKFQSEDSESFKNASCSIKAAGAKTATEDEKRLQEGLR